MSEAVWYRSLYWRIAIGFILFLASVLVIQGAVFLWLLDRSESLPGPPPRGFTRIVAADLSAALAANPGLDVERYVRATYQEQRYPFFVLMRDGRVVSSGARPSDSLVAEARSRLTFSERVVPRFDSPGRGAFRSDRPGPSPGLPRGRFGGPPGEIVVNGRMVGVVFAIPQRPLTQLGPTMAIVAAGLVIGGTALAALLIFGPVRGRLRNLEEAARRVGAGDLTARAREDGGDEVAGLAAAFNRMAADLGARAEQVQSADRTRRLLLADVSHELRTPLTAMRGYLETLSMPELMLDPETRARYVGIVSEETDRLQRIVGDLLDLAKLEGGGDSLDLQDVPLEDLFGRVAARHERESTVKRVTLATSIAPGAELVYGDPLRLEQALQNLAANALRHTPPGGRVELKAEIDGGQIVLSVRDTGPGIPPDHLPFVFERFYKIDPSRTPEAPGSGLGLSIVKAIVERHGGTIAVTSAEGGGSVFTIRLPAGDAAAE
jgi:signal transduction histidine kinase